MPATEGSARGCLCAYGRDPGPLDDRRRGGRAGRAAEERGSDFETSERNGSDSALRGGQHLKQSNLAGRSKVGARSKTRFKLSVGRARGCALLNLKTS